MRRVVIVQARMTSTRLPGKVLMELAGKPMLERQIERLRACQAVDEIAIATTDGPADDAIAALARRLDLPAIRGSEHDVLARYAQAAAATDADLVVRITSDCPLIDPGRVDAVIDALAQRRDRCDYASNTLERHLPRGLDCEALWRDVLERVDRIATSAPAREHVTWHIYAERPELFLLHAVRGGELGAELRWTVDTDADLALIRKLYDELGLADRIAPADEIVAYVRARPELAAINTHITQKDPAA
ncbi:MAG: glycosyltransferase family protein [Patulibacter sp.]